MERVNILIVDDLKENLLALGAILQRDDVAVFKAASGSAALELMMERTFAVALIDVKMPGMSGFELAEFMRGTNRTKGIPIIFVTATAKEQDLSFKGYESGAVDFLLKPLDTFAVKSKVSVFIDLYRSKAELKDQLEVIKRLKSAAELERTKLYSLFMDAPVGICVLDGPTHIFRLTNPPYVTLLSAVGREIIGRPMFEALPELKGQGFEELFDGVYQTGFPYLGKEVALMVQDADGSTVHSFVDYVYTAKRDVAGNIDGILVLVIDVTEKVLARKQIEEAVFVRDEFMSIASHELKTPLTSLKLNSQMRLKNLVKGDLSAFSPERLNKMFNSDKRQLERVTHLIDDMLDITRINSGKLTMHLERFDLCELVRDLVERTSEQFILSGSAIEIETCESVFGCWDRFRIEQVMTNLLTNAIRYGGGKPILIQVNATAGGAEIVVRDQGRGVAKENHTRIFQRFERAEKGDAISGLGLGLYIVKQILESHQGSIRLESDLGQGAAFFVDLPINKDAEVLHRGA